MNIDTFAKQNERRYRARGAKNTVLGDRLLETLRTRTRVCQVVVGVRRVPSQSKRLRHRRLPRVFLRGTKSRATTSRFSANWREREREPRLLLYDFARTRAERRLTSGGSTMNNATVLHYFSAPVLNGTQPRGLNLH